jgi:DNA helicase-2/ATP-dependent DNA helicase PcrA
MPFKMNRYQEEAADHVDGPCLVTSCPGSGKTFTLVERIVRLIQKGVSPRNIVCLTFTNKAANEMKQRICDRLNIDEPEFFIGTFHSLCVRLIRRLGPSRGYASNFSIVDDKEQADLIAQIARRMEYDLSYSEVWKIVNAVNEVRDKMEGEEKLDEKLIEDAYVEIGREYLQRCRDNNMIDFSGLIYEAIRIIESDPEIIRKVQNTFKYILVDETQDTNMSQFHLVKLMGAKYRNIMLIGDIDQSVYGWRFARYQNIRDFMAEYTDCRIICLSKNYRSTPQIVESASKLIRRNMSHMKTPFETDNPAGEPIRCFAFQDQFQEGEWVARMVRRLVNEGGWDYSDMAVLYRVNKMSEPVEQALAKEGIPYEVIGSYNFYDRREVRDVISMAKLLVNPKDGVSFHRLAGLVSGLGNVTVGRIENLAHERGVNLIEASRIMAEEATSARAKAACQRMYDVYSEAWDLSRPSECFYKLVDRFGYKNYLAEKCPKDCSERNDNVTQVIDSSAQFNGEAEGVSRYLQQISLVTSSDKETEDDKIVLMSLHAAKGLEFPIVFMVGVEQDILPHKNAIAESHFEGMEEERRLCYVGMTRAKKILYLSHCRNRRVFSKFGMRYARSKPSQFLVESGVIGEENDD